MAIVKPTQSAWSQVTGPGILQVQKGRLRLAGSGSPADGDWLVVRVGDSIEIKTAVWAQALEADSYLVILTP